MKAILIINCMIVFATIASGVYLELSKSNRLGKRASLMLKASIGACSAFMLTAVGMMVPDIAFAATTGAATSASGLGFIAAALCTGLATIGAGYAVGAVGSSALGAVSEDQSILGKTLIFVGLAEGIAIYGLIISILILGRI
ncbi:MAG: ATPase [Peptoclostridium sp.]|uniref:ATP synthase subunit C n=1 Tax=Peptoclostridium sp. TaxID=1904860 RepID=UPI00139EC6E6|nr:ATP synthase subunit C [Peptoclostridium sp.]MZQ75887.1 ATPase [Peptoclostridium sp.]